MQSMLTPLLGLTGKGAMRDNMKEVMAEIPARLTEELDYPPDRPHPRGLRPRHRVGLPPRPGKPEDFAHYREFVLYCLRPLLHDEPFAFTTASTGGSIDLALGGIKQMVFRGGRLPASRISLQ